AGIGERVPRRLGVQLERRLVRQLPVLVGLALPHDGDAPAEPCTIAAHRVVVSGLNSGSAIVSDTSRNATSTGMPIFTAVGSTSTSVVIMRGPSLSSTMASTYGVGTGKPFCPRCTMVYVCSRPLPLSRSHSRSPERQLGHAARG